MKIVVLDFETANYNQDSACALGICVIEEWQVTKSERWLICPPTNEFVFTYLHGLTWQHVCNAPKFEQRLADLEQICEGAVYLAAHNAGFDRSVLNACIAKTGRSAALPPFINTVPVAKHAFGLTSARLDYVSEKLRIKLQHHDALSDAMACAEILIRANRAGYDVTRHVMGKPKKKAVRASTQRPAHAPDTPPAYHKGMKLTEEQELIREAFKAHESTRVNAYAGTGKTKTLEALAEDERRQGIYVAFNRDVSSNARTRFSSNVEVRTIHALAMRHVRHRYSEDRLLSAPSPSQLRDFIEAGTGTRIRGLSSIEIGSLVRRVIQDFCYSDALEITPKFTIRSLKNAGAKSQLIRENALALAAVSQSAWVDMANPSGTLPLGHDGYLKVWGLSKPHLAFDYMLVDESQDISPVFIDILKRQNSQICLVGDAYQQIYQWRGATDAAAQFEDFKLHHLTQSWRFGDRIARLSNSLLRLDAHPVRGNPERDTTLNRRASRTFLFRYNGTLVEKAIALHDNNNSFSIAGGKQKILGVIDDLDRLQSGERPLNTQMLGFRSWSEFVGHHLEEENSEFRTFINLFLQHGPDRIRRALWAATEEARQDGVVLSTGHQAKGREWSSVEVSEDFLVPPQDPSEDRLLYVAMTRAVDNLNLTNELYDRAVGAKETATELATPTSSLSSLSAVQSYDVPHLQLVATQSAVPPPVNPKPNRSSPSQKTRNFANHNEKNLSAWAICIFAFLAILLLAVM